MRNMRYTTLKLLKNVICTRGSCKVVQAQATLDIRKTAGTVTMGAPFTRCYSLSKLLRNKRALKNLSVWRRHITHQPKH